MNQQTNPVRILFVCLGNICRSPMAEFIMKKMTEEAGVSDRFIIESAATSMEEYGNPVYPPARRILAAHGIGCDGKFSRKITAEDYEEYDFILGMDHSNIRNIKRICGGDPENKVHLLMDYSSRPGSEVADPWFTGDFQITWDDITDGCRGLLLSLTE